MGEITVCRYHSADEIRNIFPEVVSISKNSWKARIGADIAGDKKRYLFFKEFSETGSAKGWVTIWVLRLNDQAIAMEYHIEKDGKTFALRGDFDDRYNRHSPGAVLEYYILKSHFENKDTCEYDLCGDDYAYKMCWTNEVCRQYAFRVYNPFKVKSRLFQKFG
jgi:CelD/BcsL family acetyltransferase involved in cellulose biosynthesis